MFNNCHLDLRKRVLFMDEPENFVQECINIISEADAQKNKEDYLEPIFGLSIDLQSFLINWKLRRYLIEGSLNQSDIDSAVNMFYSFLNQNGAECLVKEAKLEVESIEKCQMRQISEMRVEGKLNTYWGHDYSSQLTYSLRRGACWVTSNPVKVKNFKDDFPEEWNSMVKEARRNHPDADITELISMLYLKVCLISARELYPIYEATNGKFGYVFMQVNPRDIKHSDKMTAEARYWINKMKDELGGKEPNIIIKLPAVHSAIKTGEALVDDGIRVCYTLSYTYYQYDLLSKVCERGKQASLVVFMTSFLDNQVAAELRKIGMKDEDADAYSHYATEAVLKKAYMDIRKKKKKSTILITAGIRGDWAVQYSITNHQDAPIYLTTVRKIIDGFDQKRKNLTSIIDKEIEEDTMRALRKSAIFNAAYDDDKLSEDNIYDYPPLVFTLKAFNASYDEVERNVLDILHM